MARRGLLAGVERLTGRAAVLLPREASEDDLLDARAPYRVEADEIHYEMNAPTDGMLHFHLLAHTSLGTPEVLWTCEPFPVKRKARLSLRLSDGVLAVDDRTVGRCDSLPLPQRFSARLALRSDGRTRCRRLGHYRVQPVADEAYFTGGHYRDYAQQAAHDVEQTMEKLTAWSAESPLLEVGCATGLLLEACVQRGFDAYGVDVSPWAVEQASARVPAGHIERADVSTPDWPQRLGRPPFRTIVMNAVLEHVPDPADLLVRVARLAAPDALLFVSTANGNSLTRWLFEDDWEGLADPTHRSAHLLTPAKMRAWCTAAGWHVEALVTHSIWDDNPDPVHATLRDVAGSDARFRHLLTQYDRGDFLECVARRRDA